MQSKKRIKKVLSTILTIVIIIAFILVGIGIYQKFTGKEILPYKVVWVITDSMEDTIPEQSYILIKKCDASEVKVNDVITFVSSDPTLEGGLNTHRVIEINEFNEFVMKGDHNKVADSFSCKRENVIGKYICNLPLITIFGRFFSTQFGLVFVLLVIIFAFVIMSGIFKKKTKKDVHQAEFDRRVAEEIKRLEEEAKKNK